MKKSSVALRSANIEESKALSYSSTKQKNIESPTDSIEDQSLDRSEMMEEDRVEIDSSKNLGLAKLKIGNATRSMKRKPKTKFEEYLQKDMEHADISAKEDLKLERRLAKKLKVKEGKLRGLEDDLNMFFEGIPSVLDSLDQEPEYDEENGSKSHERRSLGKKSKRQKSEYASDDAHGIDSIDRASEPQNALNESHSRKGKKKREMLKGDSKPDLPEPAETSGEEVSLKKVPTTPPAPEATVKYVAPHLRTRVGSESEELSKLRRRVRGMKCT